MQYQIQTAPIWDAYKNSDGCPLCKIRADREKRLVSQYLAENVMDPDFRQGSNAIGFCAEHLGMLYAGQNKLGLALQLETRAAELCSLIDRPDNKKSAKKQAAKLKEHFGCVICAALEEPMSRYVMTVAEMFANEREFPELFEKANHCVRHATMLFDVGEHAGKAIQTYLNALSSGVKRDLEKAEKDLRAFADCFDFRNAGSKPDPETVVKAIKLLR